MIQFNLSTELTAVLNQAHSEHSSSKHSNSEHSTKVLLQETAQNETPQMIWFAHTVEIKDVRCIITVEQQTRYAMVFCGLSDHDLASFEDIFKDRLWREVFAICQEGHEHIIQHLAQHIISLCQEQSYENDYDRSVHGLIRLVAADLESRVYDSQLPLPVDSGDAFEFGVEINNALRSVSDHQLQYFTPIESFKRFCLGQMNDVVPMSLFSENSLSAMARYLGDGWIEPTDHFDDTAIADQVCYDDLDNVIEVDFFTRKKSISSKST